ncbi:hypothetical protein SAMN05414137_16410 [Streptacidiphilus jiangxiensis]|uniref:Uncharacterized protein n=1 Tax=Streptacidiphilus jiangxiensis TaxID=235985 RepID=A0A1H8BHU9_STRJI|nr:hypothetical protein SAMN05414137_16410 [Streptacidiphilus jiangxiensis]
MCPITAVFAFGGLRSSGCSAIELQTSGLARRSSIWSLWGAEAWPTASASPRSVMAWDGLVASVVL